MKKYLLFKGDVSPHGGMDDYVGSFDTIEECKANVTISNGAWAQIVRHSDMKVIWDLDYGEWYEMEESR